MIKPCTQSYFLILAQMYSLTEVVLIHLISVGLVSKSFIVLHDSLILSDSLNRHYRVMSLLKLLMVIQTMQLNFVALIL